uniref:Uncharacterized protein n=2 Tax=Anopheles stephensi TaxID=30069 RepID=A0A182YJJ5_ANOST
MPRLLSDEVFQRCDNRTLPPVPPDVPAPIPANCQAECVLNETGILVHRQFMLEQAVKVLVGQVPADNVMWMRAFEVAARKCYNLVMTRTFYLQDVAKNLISSQCIPTSIRYLECTFSIIYRDCPDAYWNYNNEQCKGIVVALNNCYYLFQHVWKI